MKKLLALFAAFALVMTLTACGGEAKLPAQGEIDMTNIDEYLGRDNVQYIDLRNFEDVLAKGYISGFENIPYFHYLQAEGIITGSGDTTALGNEARVKELFDKDAEAIFLMCQSGGRAGWVKGILDGLGYTNVYNVGGWGSYEGVNAVAGDGSFSILPMVAGDYTPGKYVGADEDGVYFVTIIINSRGGIEEVLFDAVYGKDYNGDGTKTYSTKQVLGEDYGMRTKAGLTWAEMADLLADIIVANQGWDPLWKINESTTGGHDYFDLDKEEVLCTQADVDAAKLDAAGNVCVLDAVKVAAYEADDYTVDAVAGVTAGIEGFLAAWEDAIAKAE